MNIAKLTVTSFRGSCICGRIKYRTRLPSDPNTGIPQLHTRKCNCTYCQKPGYHALRLPADAHEGVDPAFILETPTGPDNEAIGVIRGPRAQTQFEANGQTDIGDPPKRYFCKGCGVHVWMRGTFDTGKTGGFRFFTVNVNTLEGEQEGLDLRNVKVEYMDGLHDNVLAGVREGPWEGGMP